METPLVSIIMTAYNAEPFIAEAISSILNQSYENWELLIADDCSTDNTRKVISTFHDSRIKTHHNTRNLHYLRTRNNLVDKAAGDFITLLDADDWCVPTRLEKQLAAFTRVPELGMCGSLVGYINKKGEPLTRMDNKPESYHDISEQITSRNVFTGSTIMVRTEVWRQVGGYRDFFNTLGYEDYDLTSRIVEKYPSINIQEPLYSYRQYPESTSKKNLLYNPFKLHGEKLVQFFIRQRQETGSDSLGQGDYPEIINFVMDLHRPYIDDPSTIYRHLMWSNINKNQTHLAFQHVVSAIVLKPLKWLNWKTLCLFFLIRMKLIKG